MRRIGSLLVGVLLGVLVGSSHADVTGHWRIEGGFFDGTPIATVVQSGTTVTLGGVTISGQIPNLTGTTSGDQIFLSDTGLACPVNVSLRMLGDRLLDGKGVIFSVAVCNPPFIKRTFATRCTCVDGNTANGDGCDAACQVEPCWSCSGDPSVCTPIADGNPCDDRRDCTTGTTCSAGACAGGTTAPGCIDVTGAWNTVYTSSFVGPIPAVTDIVQELGLVVLRDRPESRPGFVGTIDAATGVMDLAVPSTGIFCTGEATFDGTAGPISFAGTLVGQVDAPGRCVSDVGTLTGTRVGFGCGNGTVDPGEECDDGNLAAGDGCDPACHVEGCGDACPVDGCSVAPRGDCRPSRDPMRCDVQLRDGDATKDTLVWRWRAGAATAPTDFGIPTTTTDVSLCVYEGDTLRLAALAPAGGTCGARPCWTSTTPGFTYADASGAAHGLTSIKAAGGADGKAKLLVKAKGAALAPPAPPLALPVRVQLQVEDGTCFETRHDAGSVRRNVAGTFRARGAP